MVNYHLVVLVHGIWGNPSHMSYLAHQIERKVESLDTDEEIVVYKTGSHSGYLTYDGVDVNGKRIRDEIVAKTDLLNNEEKARVTKFTLIGYSLGGLMARYALGVLYHDGYFNEIKPVQFVTFCTPHVGIVNPSNSFLSRMFNLFAPYVLAQTGQHFFLKDKKLVGSEEHVPLLQWMSDPASKFYKALALFETRSLYANCINDRRTSWYTTLISNVDPFNSMVSESLSAYQLRYIDGYEPTMVDFSQPITFNKVEPVASPGFSFQRFLFKTFTWLKVLGHFLLITPIYSFFLLGNAIWQRIKMNRRLRAFYLDGADSLGALYDLVSEELESVNDFELVDEDAEKQENKGAYNDANYGNDSSYNNDTSDSDSFMDEFGERMRDETDVFVESIVSAINSASYYDYHYSVTKSPQEKILNENNENEGVSLLPNSLLNLKGKKISNDFKLKITDAQEAIVSNLNTLKWYKYPVIIRHTKATHAAVIYRHPDPDFGEGKVVVRHFVEQVFRS